MIVKVVATKAPTQATVIGHLVYCSKIDGGRVNGHNFQYDNTGVGLSIHKLLCMFFHDLYKSLCGFVPMCLQNCMIIYLFLHSKHVSVRKGN